MAIRLLHPETFHDMVKKKCMPDEDIKPSSIWVAILHHTKRPTSEVEKKELLWFKANPVTTLRTLSHYYYERNPIDELALQYKDCVPNAALSIKEIRPKIPRDNLLVLYALDGELVKDEKLKAGIRFNEENRITVTGNRGMAIQIDDDGSDDERTQGLSRHTRQSINAHKFQPTLGNASRNSVDFTKDARNLSLQEPETNLPQGARHLAGQMANGQTAADANTQHPSYIEPQSQPLQQPAAWASASRPEDEPEIPPWAPARAFQSGKDQKYICGIEQCTEAVHIQPFTEFVPSHRDDMRHPMCVGHTKGWLMWNQKHKEAAAIEEEIKLRALEKDYWHDQGWEQVPGEDIRPNKPKNAPKFIPRIADKTPEPAEEDDHTSNNPAEQVVGASSHDTSKLPEALADMDEHGNFGDLEDSPEPVREPKHATFPGRSMPNDQCEAILDHDHEHDPLAEQNEADRPFSVQPDPFANQYDHGTDLSRHFEDASYNYNAEGYAPWDDNRSELTCESVSVKQTALDHNDVKSSRNCDNEHVASPASSYGKRALSEVVDTKTFEAPVKRFRHTIEIPETDDECPAFAQESDCGEHSDGDIFADLGPDAAAARDDKDDSDYEGDAESEDGQE